MRAQVEMSEPVVLHHGREGGRCWSQRGAAVCFNSLLGGARDSSTSRDRWVLRALGRRSDPHPDRKVVAREEPEDRSEPEKPASAEQEYRGHGGRRTERA